MSLGLAHSKLRNQVTTLSNFHARTDQGLAFTLELSNFALIPNASISALLRVNSVHHIHIAPRFDTGGESKLEIFESPVVSADGSHIPPINYKRSSTYGAQSVFTLTPTILVDGLLLDTEVVPMGTGGTGSGRDHWILGPNSVILFKLTNLSNLPKLAIMHLDFYEIRLEGTPTEDPEYVIDDYITIDYVEGTQ